MLLDFAKCLNGRQFNFSASFWNFVLNIIFIFKYILSVRFNKYKIIQIVCS